MSSHDQRSDRRYVVVDSATGEVVDDAQGYGDKSAQNAHRAHAYKSMSPQKKRRRAARLHLSPAEAAALTEIGEMLGSLYRRELTGRIGLGRVDRTAQSVWRADRERAPRRC